MDLLPQERRPAGLEHRLTIVKCTLMRQVLRQDYNVLRLERSGKSALILETVMKTLNLVLLATFVLAGPLSAMAATTASGGSSASGGGSGSSAAGGGGHTGGGGSSGAHGGGMTNAAGSSGAHFSYSGSGQQLSAVRALSHGAALATRSSDNARLPRPIHPTPEPRPHVTPVARFAQSSACGGGTGCERYSHYFCRELTPAIERSLYCDATTKHKTSGR